MEALEHKGFMPPEHLMVIDTMLTMPGAMLEAEYQRRINAIVALKKVGPLLDQPNLAVDLQLTMSILVRLPNDNGTRSTTKSTLLCTKQLSRCGSSLKKSDP